VEEIWQARIKLNDLAKTAKEGDTYMGDSGYWKFHNGKWVTQWVTIQGRRISGREYEKSEQEDVMGYDLSTERGNY